jgi:KamA family protein
LKPLNLNTAFAGKMPPLLQGKNNFQVEATQNSEEPFVLCVFCAFLRLKKDWGKLFKKPKSALGMPASLIAKCAHSFDVKAALAPRNPPSTPQRVACRSIFMRDACVSPTVTISKGDTIMTATTTASTTSSSRGANRAIQPRKYRAITQRDFASLPQLSRLSSDEILSMKAVANVLPFRVNEYVIDKLIDWNAIPHDPMFQLSFPQPDMLAPGDLAAMRALIRRDAPAGERQKLARSIQLKMNPHPAGQMEVNVPRLDDGTPLPGMQHKYRETVLFFPSQGQTCHAYCTYCFRWAQFTGMDGLKFASREADSLRRYVAQHSEVSSVLLTGGDPMLMSAALLSRYIEPLLEIDHVSSVRIGTKALAWWPYRFVTDSDADDVLRLFERVVKSGRHLAFMAHYTHPREMETRVAQTAIKRVRETGAVIRCQAPLVRHINDDPLVWASLWGRQVVLGMVPYYMFVERDTGPKNYFEVPLARACDIFSAARQRMSGLGRTARGPSMSTTPGKVLVDGVAEIRGEKVFVLKFIQGRDPSWTGRVFFAKYDDRATWLDQLKPAFGEKDFFFETAMREIKTRKRAPAWGNRSRLVRRLSEFGHVEWM